MESDFWHAPTTPCWLSNAEMQPDSWLCNKNNPKQGRSITARPDLLFCSLSLSPSLSLLLCLLQLSLLLSFPFLSSPRLLFHSLLSSPLLYFPLLCFPLLLPQWTMWSRNLATVWWRRTTSGSSGPMRSPAVTTPCTWTSPTGMTASSRKWRPSSKKKVGAIMFSQ